jgi:hypothetical protein
VAQRLIAGERRLVGLANGRVETRERVHAAAGRGDPGGEAVLGGVVDDRADAPDPTARCFELAEVGQSDPIAFGRRVVEHLAAQRRLAGDDEASSRLVLPGEW